MISASCRKAPAGRTFNNPYLKTKTFEEKIYIARKKYANAPFAKINGNKIILSARSGSNNSLLPL